MARWNQKPHFISALYLDNQYPENCIKFYFLIFSCLSHPHQTDALSHSLLPTEEADLSDLYQSGVEENGLGNKIEDEINGNWISAPAGTVHEARLKAKAKRRLRKNSSRDSGRGDSLSDNGDAVRSAVPPTSPKGRVLDRRSRLGKGRGLPKKGTGTFCLNTPVLKMKENSYCFNLVKYTSTQTAQLSSSES